MDNKVREQLRALDGVQYVYNKTGTIIRYKGLDIFKLNDKNGDIAVVYIENMRKLNKDCESKLVSLFQCYLGWEKE